MSAETATRPLVEQVAEVVKAGEVTMPPLPEVEAELSRLLEDDDVTTKRIVEVVKKDPSVAATILRLANSAAYGGLQPVTELGQALTRIGLTQLKRTVTAALHKGHFEHSSAAHRDRLKGLWMHSITTAVICRLVAEHVCTDQHQAFLAGLLHDSGKLLVLRAVDHLSERQEVDLTDAVLDEMMVALHTELGYVTLEEWKLPEEICAIARDHHNDVTSKSGELLIRVQAANLIAHELKQSNGDLPASQIRDAPEVAALNMTDVELASLIIDVEDEVEELVNALG